MEEKITHPLRYSWESDIQPHLDTLKNVEGGFTHAKRGIVTLADGARVFVKIAPDELTQKWLKKEIKVYQKLNAAGYKYIPELLASAQDHTAMAIEYLDDSVFDGDWDEAKLGAVIRAQESLRDYANLFVGDPDFRSGSIVDLGAKWPHILESDNLESINKKLVKLGGSIRLTQKEIEIFEQMHVDWSLREDTLVHHDVRADNFGYDPRTKSGKLIDWNWLCLGDESLDVTALFINIYKSGFNPYELHPEKYDAKMLAYLISFWMNSLLNGNEDSSKREWELRAAQTKSIEACVALLASR